MKTWLKSWIWPFDFSRDGHFKPRDDFVLPLESQGLRACVPAFDVEAHGFEAFAGVGSLQRESMAGAIAGAFPLHDILEQEFGESVDALFSAASVAAVYTLELPASAIDRVDALCHVVQKIAALGSPGSSGLVARPPPASARYAGRESYEGRMGFQERKQAWDIISKWIFYVVAADGSGKPSAPAQCEFEPVLPSRTDAPAVQWLAAQLYQMYRAHHAHVPGGQDDPHWRRLADELTRFCARTATELYKKTEARRAQWQQRLQKGQRLSDARLCVSKRSHPTDSLSMQVGSPRAHTFLRPALVA